MRIKFSLLAVSLLGIASVARGDSLSVGQIAQELKQDAAIPLAPSVGNQLAKNLLAAQAAAPYTQFEPDSVQLSIEAVLRAIGLYASPGGPTMITDEASEPFVWIQSRIAIDDRLTATLTPNVWNPGN